MNTRKFFPFAVLSFAVAGLLTTAAGSLAELPTDAPISTRITEFPTITVRPAPQDAAYFRAHRIVDLPRITVRPESADLALFLADNTVRVAHLPVLLPQAPLPDRQMIASNALAAR